ncbi:hypothetical protein EYF80_026780 [Liparis tanakae]|uniref:Uncharacterized protein n=1 Tax=Liparis tanakae TaxID=230148 RepID=A0A4Z2HBG6_9TELE|nr:hypothetical protein EYF80_026780 [Liparis tanakae]
MEQATAGLDLELYAGNIYAGPEGIGPRVKEILPDSRTGRPLGYHQLCALVLVTPLVMGLLPASVSVRRRQQPADHRRRLFNSPPPLMGVVQVALARTRSLQDEKS